MTVGLEYHGQFVELQNVLLDTGSAGSVFSTDKLLAIGIQYEPNDEVRRIRGVGGSEFVFVKKIGRITLRAIQINDFIIEVGAMDYGFEIDGIIGMDFLIQAGAVIDLNCLVIKEKKKHAN